MRARALSLVFLAWLAWLAGCSGSERPRNLLVITIDTLRADHLGACGYPDAHTANLDALAAQGWFFADAMAQAPLTLPSHCSLFTGLLPPTHGVRDNTPQPLAPEVDTLAEQLRRRGYHTAAFVGGQPLQRGCGLEQGFDRYDSPIAQRRGALALPERRADEIAARGIAWLEQARGPFFLWLHFFDPHEPYAPPSPYREQARTPYDGEIAYVDSEIGRVLAALDRLALRASTLIVVAADHGESLGEHGEATHGFLVYQSTLRVPLLFSGQTVPQRRDPRIARLIDVVPTVLDLLGVGGTPACQGVSLLAADPGPAYAESLYAYHHFHWAQLTCMREGGRKRIDGPGAEIYDLGSDPVEHRPLERDAALDLERALEQVRSLERVPAQGPTSLASLGYFSSPPPPGGWRLLAPSENAARRAPATSMGLVQQFLDGLSAMEAKQWSRALVLLQAVVAADPANPMFRLWTARAERQCGATEHDPRLLEAALARLDGLAAEGRGDAFALGLQTLGQLGRHAEAAARGEEAIRSGRADAEAYHVLGLVYLDAANPDRRPARAVELLEEARLRKPNDLLALQALLDAYTEAGLQGPAGRLQQEIKRLEAGDSLEAAPSR